MYYSEPTGGFFLFSVDICLRFEWYENSENPVLNEMKAISFLVTQNHSALFWIFDDFWTGILWSTNCDFFNHFWNSNISALKTRIIITFSNFVQFSKFKMPRR